MMLHTKSSSRSYCKLLALLPIVGITLALNARTVTDYVYNEPQKQVPVKKGKKAATIKMGGQQVKVVEQPKVENTTKPVEMPNAIEVGGQRVKVVEQPKVDNTTKPVEMPNAIEVVPKEQAFDIVEQMPEYPGGAMAMFEYLSKSIKYPKEAAEAQKEGRVIATFIVNKDGTISDARVVKSVDPALDAEALRVINGMPNWKPGKQNGKVVNVKYTIPISFRLQAKETIMSKEK